jgi:hypothetical protein
MQHGSYRNMLAVWNRRAIIKKAREIVRKSHQRMRSRVQRIRG